MDIGYQQFVRELQNFLMERLKLSEENIYFKEQGSLMTEDGDRLFIEFADYGEAKEVCVIHTEALYERCLDGEHVEKLAMVICEDVQNAIKAGYYENAKKLENYEEVRSELFIRLLNFKKHREKLDKAVYRVVGDIALVLYMRIESDGSRMTSVKVVEEYVEKWNKNKEEVLEAALLNTYFMMPPRIYQWEKLIFDPAYAGENFMNLFSDFEIKKDAMGNCLSTVSRTNGAVAAFLPGVADRICNLMNSDIYLVFTSIHEVMVHSDVSVCIEDLQNILRETIVESTPEEDVLTWNIYHYSRETGIFSCVTKE